MQFYHIKRRENWLNICGTNCLIWLIKVNRDFDVHAVIDWIKAKRASDWFGLHKQARISWSREIASLCLNFSVGIEVEKTHYTMNLEVTSWIFNFLNLISFSFAESEYFSTCQITKFNPIVKQTLTSDHLYFSIPKLYSKNPINGMIFRM